MYSTNARETWASAATHGFFVKIWRIKVEYGVCTVTTLCVSRLKNMIGIVKNPFRPNHFYFIDNLLHFNMQVWQRIVIWKLRTSKSLTQWLTHFFKSLTADATPAMRAWVLVLHGPFVSAHHKGRPAGPQRARYMAGGFGKDRYNQRIWPRYLRNVAIMVELHMALIGYSYCRSCYNWLVAISYTYGSRNVPASALVFAVTQSHVGPPSIVCTRI